MFQLNVINVKLNMILGCSLFGVFFNFIFLWEGISCICLLKAVCSADIGHQLCFSKLMKTMRRLCSTLHLYIHCTIQLYPTLI